MDLDRATILCRAASYKNTRIMRTLIDVGIDYVSGHSNQTTPLTAALHDSGDAFDLLLEEEADPSMLDNRGIGLRES